MLVSFSASGLPRLVPQPFVYDQDEYYGYALGILNKGLHADLYRLYGYPLIIAPLVYFFGEIRSAVDGVSCNIRQRNGVARLLDCPASVIPTNAGIQMILGHTFDKLSASA